MALLGNLLWLLLGGLLISAYYAIFGILLCITIIGIPFGVQLIKIAGLALCPFGRDVQYSADGMGGVSILMNILWIILGGIEICVLHLIIGAVCCLTIIGIPLGLQHFKMAKLAFIPFGQKVS